MMKKLLFCFMFLAFAFHLNAQTVLYQDDFESYTVGGYLAVQSDWWTTWSNAPGTGEDALIVTTQANSPTKSVKIDGDSDLLLPMGKVSGKYQIEFYYYVQSGFGGYYNLQRLPSPGVEWVIEVYFANNGTGLVHAGGQNAATFNYTQNQWVHIKNVVDIDADWAEFYLNNTLVHGWQWSLSSQGSVSPHGGQLGGVNIFAGAPTGQTPSFWMDDFTFTELAAGQIPEIAYDPEEFIVDVPAGGTTTANLNVSNVGNAPLLYDVEVNYAFPATRNNPVIEYTEDFTFGFKNTVRDLITGPVSSAGNDAPSYPENVILSYDGPNVTGVGFPNPNIYEVAARFPNSMTLPHAGMQLTKVDIYLNHTESCTFRIKVYGEGTDYEPGVVYIDQAFTAPFPDWYSITLNTPITITGEDLWIGYRVVQNAGGIFPVGADAGPANPNGHFIKPGAGWTVSTLDRNWNIKGLLTGDGITQWLSVAPASGELDPNEDEDHTVTFNASSLQIGSYEAVLKLRSNDVANPKISLPVTLGVGSGIEDPTIVVNPTSLEEILAPDGTSTQNLSIGNIGQEDLTFDIEIEYIAKKGAKFENKYRDYGYFDNSHLIDADPTGEIHVVDGSRDMFDLQFQYDLEAVTGALGNAGSGTDGTYLYSARWASNLIHKMNLDGTLVEQFSVPGVSGLRDMTFDGQYIYGSNATAGTGIWQLDLQNKVLVSTIPCTFAVRSISYDPVADGFWVNNFSDALKLISRTGAVLQTLPAPPSMYGSAYDGWTPGGPYLWIFTGTSTGGGCQVQQLSLATGTLTGLSYSISTNIPGNGIAGGLWSYEGLVPGTVTLGGVSQGTPDMLFGLELHAVAPPPEGWLSANPISGTVTTGQNLNIEIGFDAAGIDYGEYEALIIISSNDPSNPVVEVPVTLIVSDQVAPVIVVDPMSLTQAIAANEIATQEMTIGNEGVGTLNYDIEIEYQEGFGPDVVLINEGFEGVTFPPAGWARFNVGGGTGWQILGANVTPIPGWQGGTATPAPNGGAQMAFCTWQTGGSVSNDQWLVTPQVNVSGDTYLTFWMRYWPDSYYEKVEIKLSTTAQNNASAFTIMVDELVFNTGSSVDWEFYSYNLADFVAQGTNVYIAFREVVADNFNDGAAIFLDNVKVEQTLSWLSVNPDAGSVVPMDEDVITVTFNSAGLSIGVYTATMHVLSNDPDNSNVQVPVTLDVITGINELGEPNAVMVYPNPATDYLRIQANHTIREIKLYNNTGQLVAAQRVDDQSASISTTEMPTGLYLLQIETEAGISSRKIMIR